MEPENLQEWIDFILNEIPMEELIFQAQAIGAIAFQNQLQQEGYTGEDLLAIYRAVALRFTREDFRIPSQMDECIVDYQEIADFDPNNPLNMPQ